MSWVGMPPAGLVAVALASDPASGTVVAVGGRVASGELLTEVPQPLDRPRVDRPVLFAERRLYLLVDLGFEAAAAAVLEMLGDLLGGTSSSAA